MAITDKRGFLSDRNLQAGLVLDIGCGSSKFSGDAIGIDMLDLPGVDIVGDVFQILKELRDGSVRYAYCSHFCEHISDIELFSKELHRVLEPAGTAKIVTPHFSNPFYYSDPTHKQFFGLYTFSYICCDNIFRRKVPSYARIDGLHLFSVKLVFKAVRPRYFTHAFRKVVQIVFNSTDRMKEFYEGSFCWFLPCYEIEYLLMKGREFEVE